ncbi:MAG: hypothetical protein KOO60_03630 [Gemmatimonadales bacterium]|nr:hypothetical protein [Gemmatimonadales bacterium]
MNFIRKHFLKFFLLMIAVVFSLAGCGPSPQERTIHLACQALKAQDWEAFSKLTITEADFLIAENLRSGRGAESQFARNSLRPEQLQLLKEQFDQAIRGGDYCLDFSRCQYVFPTLNRTSTRTTFSGEIVPVEEYILIIEMDGPERSAPGLGPNFLLVPWEDGYRIQALKFPHRS